MIRRLFGAQGYMAAFRHRLFTILEAVLFTLVISVLAIVVIQVFSRYALRASTPWAGELSQVLLVWMTMLGAAIALERKEHYVISFLIDLVPVSLRTVVMTVTNCLGAALLILLIHIGWGHVQDGFTRTYIATGIPQAVTFLSVPTAAVLMLFSTVGQSLEALATFRPSRSGKTAAEPPET